MQKQFFIFLSFLGGCATALAAATTTIPLTWECPQHNYLNIKQLPVMSKIKATFSNKSGELIVQLHPNLFNGASSSVRVDYGNCLTKLEQQLKPQIENLKRTRCQQQVEMIACTREADELTSALSRTIKAQKFFSTNITREIPTRLPGYWDTQLDQQSNENTHLRFCNENESDETQFSENNLIKLSASTSYALNAPGLVCLNKFKVDHAQLTQKIISSACPEPIKLCQQVTQSLKQTRDRIDKIIATKQKKVEEHEANFRDALGHTIDGEAALAKLLPRLDKQPLTCHELTNPLVINNRTFPLTSLPMAFSQYSVKIAELTDADCIRTVTQNYAVQLAFEGWRRLDVQEHCQAHMSTFCEEVQEKENLHRQNLRQLFAMGYGEAGANFVDNCTDCSQSPGTQIKYLLDKIKDSKEMLACLELKPGESKVVTWREGSPSGVGGNYSLKKRSDGGFDVAISMKIRSDEPNATMMMERVQNCIKDVTPYLKGPRGEELNLQILSPTQTMQLPSSQRPPVNEIQIQPANTRSNSVSYSANIDCPTITHEVLHLLGLCDEYSGVADGFTCRATPKIASIMSSQREAFKKVIPETHTCECKEKTCTAIMGGNDNLKRSVYVSESIYSLTDYQLRNEYCSIEESSSINWNEEDHSIPHIVKKHNDYELYSVSYAITSQSNKVVPTHLSCHCKTQNEKCASDLRLIARSIEEGVKNKKSACPPGAELVKSEKGINPKQSSNFSWDGKRFKVARPSDWPSLLHPQHYERIVGGSCPKVAEKYSQCAQWAYRTKQDTNNCQGKPAYCDSDKEFLGVSQ